VTADELQVELQKLTFAGGLQAWNLRFGLDHNYMASDTSAWCLVCHFTVPDRDTGVPVSLTFGQAFSVDELQRLRPVDVPALAHRAARQVVLHELNEAFQVDGKRWFDPHDPRAYALMSSPPSAATTLETL
jgi:hypothetical protein